MDLSFEHTGYNRLFAGVALLLLLFWVVLQWKKKTGRRIGDPQLVALLVADHSPRAFTFRFILVLLAFTAGVVAAMNPRTAGERTVVTKKGIDIAIALDVSKSMLASDLAPSRLDRAKQFLNKLLTEMPNDRVALVVFAGKAYLQMPFTTDHGAAGLYIASASPDLVPQQGTVLSDALSMSARAFTATGDQFKTIILISDGEDHDDAALATARDLSKEGVMINSIGIGTPEGAPVPDLLTGGNKKDEAGNTVLSRLNEDLLRQVAAATNGTYLRLQSSDEAVALLKEQLAGIGRKQFSDPAQWRYRTWYLWPAALLFILLLAEIFIPEKRKQLLA